MAHGMVATRVRRAGEAPARTSQCRVSPQVWMWRRSRETAAGPGTAKGRGGGLGPGLRGRPRPRGERNFTTWLAPLRSSWAGDGLDLAAPDPITRERVARHFLGAIEDALADALGQRYPVRLGLAVPLPSLPISATCPSPDHTFDTFVVGDSNRDACAA